MCFGGFANRCGAHTALQSLRNNLSSINHLAIAFEKTLMDDGNYHFAYPNDEEAKGQWQFKKKEHLNWCSKSWSLIKGFITSW